MENTRHENRTDTDAARLMLGVADAFADATARDRAVAVLAMCTDTTGLADAAFLGSVAGSLDPVAFTSAAARALESTPEASLRSSVASCVESAGTVTKEFLPSDVPFDGHAAAALNAGFHHEYVLPVASRSEVLGVVVLYDADELGRGREGLRVAAPLVSVAGVLMRHARTADISVELAGQLRSALDGRVVIEQAKGLLAGRDGVGIDDAFRILRMRARNERRSVADVAAETVSSLRSTPR
ncbi:MAG: hypothetical protein RL383_659 [Actinomycetota bacterium]